MKWNFNLSSIKVLIKNLSLQHMFSQLPRPAVYAIISALIASPLVIYQNCSQPGNIAVSSGLFNASSISQLMQLSYPVIPQHIMKNSDIGTWDLNVQPKNISIKSYDIQPDITAATGLVFNKSNGQISGKASVFSPLTAYQITAHTFYGDVKMSISFAVDDLAPITSYTPDANYYLGVASSLSPKNTGGAVTSYSITSGSLPAGLSLDPSTGIITGSPSVLGTSNVQITASNATAKSVATLNMNVVKPFIYTSTIPTQIIISQSVNWVAQVLPSVSSKSFSISPSLPAGLSLNPATGAITGAATSITPSATYTVTAFTNLGNFTTSFSFNVQDMAPSTLAYAISGTYYKGVALTAITPTHSGGGIKSYAISPSLPSGFNFDPSTGTISGTPSNVNALTTYTVTATGNDLSTLLAIFSFDIKIQSPISITYDKFANPYYNSIAVSNLSPVITGGTESLTYSISSGSLPNGLSISASTGIISGTPSLIGSYSATIKVANSTGSASTNLAFTVQDVPASSLSYSVPTNFTINTALSLSPVISSTTGIVYSVITGALPTGVSLNSSTGIIAGTPKALGTFKASIQAKNSSSTLSTDVTMNIVDKVPVINYASTNIKLNVNTAMATQTPSSTGGAVTSCTSDKDLKLIGLVLSDTCVISGTPTKVQALTGYVITAHNSGGDSVSQTINITVNEAFPVLSISPTDYVLTKNTALAASIVPNNSGGVVTSCVSAPSLPIGLNLGSDCSISGTPSLFNTTKTAYKITGSTTAGDSGNFTINLTINDALPNLSFSMAKYSATVNDKSFSVVPSNSGGTATSCSSSPSLPAQLNLNSDCSISTSLGAAAAQALQNYTLTAKNSGGSKDFILALEVIDQVPSISYLASNNDSSIVKTDNHITLTVNTTLINSIKPSTSGSGTIICSLNEGIILPSGLTLNSDCSISGTPNVITATSDTDFQDFIINAKNSNPAAAQVTLSIRVQAVSPVIKYTQSTLSFTVNSKITDISANSTGGDILHCSVLADDNSTKLPDGLTLNDTTCAITGTPTKAVAAQNYTITAINTGGKSTQVLNIVVNDLLPNIQYTQNIFEYFINDDIGNITPTNTGGGTITSCESTDLPAGVVIDNLTCVLSSPSKITKAQASKDSSISINKGAQIVKLNFRVIGPGTPSTQTSGTILAVGTAHSCFIDDSKNLYCWGDNTYGQLGIGSNANQNQPTLVKSLKNVVAVAAGANHTCAIGDSSTYTNELFCWGENTNGQIGIGAKDTVKTHTSPLRIAHPGLILLPKFISIALGDQHTCSIDENGSLYCWGDNSKGQLGIGSTTDKYSPLLVSSLSNVTKISLGSLHTCAIGDLASDTNSVFCWGDNTYGQLGDGNNTLQKSPIFIANGLTDIQLGSNHSCALDSSGSIYCAGDNSKGQLGTGNTTSSNTPVKNAFISGAKQLSAGGNRTCAILTDNSLSCWGDNSTDSSKNYLSLTDAGFKPEKIIGDLTSVIQVGSSHTCALVNSKLECWGGSNSSGQLGYNDNSFTEKYPVQK